MAYRTAFSSSDIFFSSLTPSMNFPSSSELIFPACGVFDFGSEKGFIRSG